MNPYIHNSSYRSNSSRNSTSSTQQQHNRRQPHLEDISQHQQQQEQQQQHEKENQREILSKKAFNSLLSSAQSDSDQETEYGDENENNNPMIQIDHNNYRNNEIHNTAIDNIHNTRISFPNNDRMNDATEIESIVQNVAILCSNISTYVTNEIHQRITKRIKELIENHNVEQRKMEEQIQELSSSVANSQNALLISRQSEQHLQSELDAITLKLSEAHIREQALLARIENINTEMHQKSDELVATSKLVQEMNEKYQNLEATCRDQEDHLHNTKSSENEVKQCLESLFGDMVQLARLYVVNENEVGVMKEKFETKIQDYQRRLQIERNRRDEIERRDQENQSDHDLLKRKYHRLKEKLEKERMEYQQKLEDIKQQNKRNNPIAYMNQLHYNMSNIEGTATSKSDRTEVRKMSSTSGGGGGGRNSNNIIDKENTHSFRSGSTNSRRDHSSHRYN